MPLNYRFGEITIQMKIHKFLVYVMALTLPLTALTACGDVDNSLNNASTQSSVKSNPSTPTPVSEKSLYEHGPDVITLMDEMLMVNKEAQQKQGKGSQPRRYSVQ